MSNQTKQFVKGALLLTVAGILTKFINMFFKVPLQALIGDEGLAFYYNPYPIYTIFIAVFITGISSAMSKMVSEKLAHNEYRQAHGIFKHMMVVLVILGALMSLCLWLFADSIVSLAGWAPATVWALRGMALSPMFLAVVGGLRGYFQGMQNMVPPAFSQVFESLGKVFFGIGLVVLVLSKGKPIGFAAAGASLGLSIGVGMSMLYLIFMYKRHQKAILANVKSDKHQEVVNFKPVLKKVLLVAIPIAIGAACYTVMNAIDSFTIVRQIKGLGFTYEMANSMMGQKIKADTFINIPMVMSVSLVISILPAISQAVAVGSKEQLLSKITIASKLAYLVALPASMGIFILAEPLLKLFFFTNASGANVLAIYSFSVLFVIMAQTYTAVLQGIGSVYRPVINLCIAATVKLVLNMLLINSSLLVSGAVLSSVIAYSVLAVLNYLGVRKKAGYKIQLSFVLKVFFTTCVMTIATYFTYRVIRGIVPLLIVQIGLSVLVAVTIYGLGIILTKALTEEDFNYIPMGNTLYKIINKYIYRG